MKAVCWCGTRRVRVEEVPEPRILDPRDIIVRLTVSTVCGSDLHIYGGHIATMHKGDILGHEITGIVTQAGAQVRNFKPGDRVVASPIIGCGQCWYCRRGQFSMCDNSNPNAAMQEQVYGSDSAGVFGYSHMFGGYAGAQAQYIRIPYADVGTFKVPDGMSDEQALACSDVFPTGLMGADLCDIQPGDSVAVWGCGPVGLCAARSALLLGAERVFAIDNLPKRLHFAAERCGAIPVNQNEVDVADYLKQHTGGRGPDACIDAVGMEAHGTYLLEDYYDRAKQALMLETDRPAVLRQMISCCRKGGTLSIMGVYAGFADKVPLGLAMNKGLQWRMGQMHGPKYIPRCFDLWRKGRADFSFMFTHRLPLEEAPRAYQMFRDKEDDCVKVLLMTA